MHHRHAAPFALLGFVLAAVAVLPGCPSGACLLKVCEGRLKEAELKIEKLKKAKDGTAAFEPYDSSRSE